MGIEAKAFKLLTWIKEKRSKKNRMNILESLSAKPISHTLWTAELTRFVSKEGWVDYENWQKDAAGLRTYLNILFKKTVNISKKNLPHSWGYLCIYIFENHFTFPYLFYHI